MRSLYTRYFEMQSIYIPYPNVISISYIQLILSYYKQKDEHEDFMYAKARIYALF